MKIAVWHNLPSGGGKRALYHHVLGLVKQGHIVESWCPPTADQTYLPLNKIIREHIVPFPRLSGLTNIRLVRLMKGFYGVAEGIKAMDEHCRQCAKEINSEGFDLLFANSCSFYGPSFIGRHIKIPKIVYLGEPYRRLYEAMPKLPWAALPPQRLGGRCRT